MKKQTSETLFIDTLSFDSVMKINSVEDDNVRAEVLEAVRDIPFLFNQTKKNRNTPHMINSWWQSLGLPRKTQQHYSKHHHRKMSL